MTETVMVRALRPFEGSEGYKDENSEPFGVSQARYGDLKAVGLVEATSEALRNGVSSDVLTAALTEAEGRLQAAKDAADQAVSAEEERIALARTNADAAVAAEEARAADAKARADEVVAEAERRTREATAIEGVAKPAEDASSEGGAKNAEDADNAMAPEPENKAAQRSARKAN